MSTSYGETEDLISPNLAKYVLYFCCIYAVPSEHVTVWSNLRNMLAQLGARGVSVPYSSGDGGVSGNHWNP